MTPAELSLIVQDAVRRAMDEGALKGAGPPSGITVGRPRAGGCGDWASNAALRLAGPVGLPPLRVAEILRDRLAGVPGIERVDVTGPGFLNFTLGGGSGASVVRAALAAGVGGGGGDGLRGSEVVLREPGEARAAVVTEVVARLLRGQGARVEVRADRGERLRVVPADPDVRRYGADAVRWALLRPAGRDRALDPAPLLVQTEANGLFTVRYAHARTRAVLGNAEALGVRAEPGEDGDARLLRALGDWPETLAGAARLRAPDRVARQLEAVADAFLGFQHTVLPRGDEKPSAAHRARLALAEAAGTVLAGGLSLLGISAPVHL
ncbi:DALR anticodon-binding domain-containing protein [Streptomyces sp. LP05-1]|uniref:arginine--tRNA ligase n=1 Tax=Streptomyces pyxinae TaxID=2970734 RepID=A0ABT2CAA0_9ACTN|nr:arginine--tRNA ligase [Streptomyces sp. LP05-1]MCS0634245.1 DALR anticodon-binding domain-containing protein [Streptomyces sp. LP05-1]